MLTKCTRLFGAAVLVKSDWFKHETHHSGDWARGGFVGFGLPWAFEWRPLLREPVRNGGRHDAWIRSLWLGQKLCP